MEGTEKRHPIQVVARRTGMTADRLRAWEKRYGVVEPGRSDGGRRLYSDEDIELLRLLHRAILGGRRISRVASLDVGELSDLVREDEEAESQRPIERLLHETGDAAGIYLEACLAAVRDLDARELDAVLKRAVVNLSANIFIESVAAPLMKEMGDRWREGELSPAHEHLGSQVVRRILEGVIEATEPESTAPRVVVSTPAGQVHEFGALFAAATASALGWRVTYLGPDLPAEDIARVAVETGATAVALSLVYPLAENGVESELRDLKRQLPEDVTLIIGGGAAPSYRRVLREIEATGIESFAALRQALDSLA